MTILLDGLNEKGLTCGLFYFPGYAGYQQVSESDASRTIAPWELSTWILSQFATVDEVREKLAEIRVAPVALPAWGFVPPAHYIVHDASGNCLVIEYVHGKLNLFDNPIGVFTNSPTFDWHLTNLRNYVNLTAGNAPTRELDGLKFEQFGQGSGMLGLPGDFTPPSRFVRAAVFSATALASPDARSGIFGGFHLLNNFDIPYGVAREEVQGVTHADQTIFTTMRDPQNLRIYYKSYDDQTIRMVDHNHFDLNAKDVMRLPTPTTFQAVVDMSGQFQPRKTADAAE
jgi:choloylglycine hydrolase